MSKGHSLAMTYADRINGQWQQSTQAIIDTGRLLIEAKNKVVPAEFEDMLDNRLRFGERTAQRLMKIAGDKRILATHVSLLPNHWSTLHALTGLDDEQFNASLRDGLIRADMERKDVPKPRKSAQKSLPPAEPIMIEGDYQDITEEARAPVLPVAHQDRTEMSGAVPLDGNAPARNAADDVPAGGQSIVTDLPEGGITEGHEREIITAVQEPAPHHEGKPEAEPDTAVVEARGQGSDQSEKVKAGGEAANLRPSSEGGHIPDPAGSLTPGLYSFARDLLKACFPTTEPSATTEGVVAQFQMKVLELRRQAAVAGQHQTRSGITIDPSDHELTFEICTALAMVAVEKIDIDSSTETWRPPLYPDDAEAYARRVSEWADAFREYHPNGNIAAVERDAE